MEEREKGNGLHELALQAKHGDRKALEKVLIDRKIKSVIYAIANKMVGQDNADDVYQEVRLKVAQKIRTWQGESKITNWISRMTVNWCLTVQRQAEQERKKRHDWTVVTKMKRTRIPSQFIHVVAQEKKAIIQKALQEMGEPCEQMLTSYFFKRMEKKAILEAFHGKKSSFYETWNTCYEMLTRKVEKILQNWRKT